MEGVGVEAFHAKQSPLEAVEAYDPNTVLAEGRLSLSEVGSSNRRHDFVTRDFHGGLQET